MEIGKHNLIMVMNTELEALAKMVQIVVNNICFILLEDVTFNRQSYLNNNYFQVGGI